MLHCVANVAQVDAQGSLDLIDVLKLDDRVADATVDAKNTILSSFVLYNCTEWHPFEQVVELLEHTVGFVDVLMEALGTLLAETKIAIDVPIFVVASQKENLARILQLKRQKEANDLK